MPALDNTRHELFAQGVASGKTQVQAYIDAGYESLNAEANAFRLMDNDGIYNRIEELKERSARAVVLTLAKATTDLLRLAEKGERLNDAPGFSVAKSAIMDACKLNGLVIDRSDNKTTLNLDDALSQLVKRG
jgi:phage terminase small subunit